MYVMPAPPEIHIYQYILDIKQFFHQILWQLSRGALETPQTIANSPISHRFISLLSDIIHFTKALSHHYADAG